jgi:hypothetical protein
MQGELLKEDGMTTALEGSPTWSIEAQQWIRDLPSGQHFTSEDLTFFVGLPRATGSNNAVGAIVNSAARRGQIRRIGFAQAFRAVSHARMIAIWERT